MPFFNRYSCKYVLIIFQYFEFYEPQTSIDIFLKNIFFRGFGFVTFADVKGVDNVLAQGSHDLDGKKVDIKIQVSCP